MKNMFKAPAAWVSSGSPWIWLNGGAVAVCMIMVVGLLTLIAVRGLSHFWPANIVLTSGTDNAGTKQIILSEVVRSEVIPAAVARDNGYTIEPERKFITRYLMKLGNRDITSRDFMWFLEIGMDKWSYPKDAVVVERREWGNFYGYLESISENGNLILDKNAPRFWEEIEARLERSLKLHDQIAAIEKADIGSINNKIQALKLEHRTLELNGIVGKQMAEAEAEFAARKTALETEYEVIKKQRDVLTQQAKRDQFSAKTADGKDILLSLDHLVRITRPNNMGVVAKTVDYVDRGWEFLTTDPREANTEGGIFPAIFGTFIMVIVMAIIVTPFGVLAAIYLREYAKDGLILRIIRISVYNLAGVPSIVYGVFGLGFFVYYLGGNIDQLFYPESLPSPTFGTPGLFWASLTLALLTLPIVIVSTEEGLSRIPSTIRQGSLALGATKSETLWKVVVPLATPAMMTGLILAIARAAGEVAPLMLVGVVKLAPALPVDGNYPYVHLDQKIMHLGFHIYDVGFQSPNVEAARPLVYATSLTLILLIIALNVTAIKIRNNLREKYRSASD
jgi:phosphate transport system permease protein